jgi:hypothetical protein
MDDILKETMNTTAFNGVELLPGEPLRDLEYADDIILASGCVLELQDTLNNITVAARRFGLDLSPGKCKVMVFDWSAPAPALTLNGNTLEVVDSFIYLGCRFSTNGSQEETTNRIAKARAAFTNLHHLWRRRDVSLSLKGRVYNATVRAVLLYGCETWTTRVEDVQRLTVFDHRCLRSIARVWWEQRVSNDEVRRRVFGIGSQSHPIGYALKKKQLRWLGHVLRMPQHRLPRRALQARATSTWKRRPGGQRQTWRKCMKSVTAPLGSVGSSRLPGWGPKDDDCAWLLTVSDMTQNRCQWRMCCDSLLS